MTWNDTIALQEPAAHPLTEPADGFGQWAKPVAQPVAPGSVAPGSLAPTPFPRGLQIYTLIVAALKAIPAVAALGFGGWMLLELNDAGHVASEWDGLVIVLGVFLLVMGAFTLALAATMGIVVMKRPARTTWLILASTLMVVPEGLLLVMALGDFAPIAVAVFGALFAVQAAVPIWALQFRARTGL